MGGAINYIGAETEPFAFHRDLRVVFENGTIDDIAGQPFTTWSGLVVAETGYRTQPGDLLMPDQAKLVYSRSPLITGIATSDVRYTDRFLQFLCEDLRTIREGKLGPNHRAGYIEFVAGPNLPFHFVFFGQKLAAAAANVPRYDQYYDGPFDSRNGEFDPAEEYVRAVQTIAKGTERSTRRALFPYQDLVGEKFLPSFPLPANLSSADLIAR